MIDLSDSNAVYYYHFDGLGSVVALTDANGTCVQTYEYSVYGHVAASDPNHPNPFMFTGREFDVETGLYYYRARYYSPYIGRFLQTDPVDYGYGYCGNNPVGRVDPSGLSDLVESADLGGWYLSGPWKVIEGGVDWKRLVWWYFWGEGVGMWFVGDKASAIVLEDLEIRHSIRDYLLSVAWSMLACAPRESMSLPIQDDIPGYGGVPQAWVTTGGWAYYFMGGSFATKNLLGGGILYIGGRITQIWSYDWKSCWWIVTAKYSFFDFTDLHPLFISWGWPPKLGGHPEDTVGKILEILWNTGLWTPYPTTQLAWLLVTRFMGKVAQPYRILITSEYRTVVMRYKTGSATPEIVSKWP